MRTSKTRVLWKANPGPQQKFLASPCYEVMYGGQAGGGKSDALLIAPLRWVHEPSFRGILFRNTYEDVVRSLGERSELIYPVAFPGAQYNQATHTWTFPTGAKIYLSYLAKDSDAKRHKGQEYQFVGFDELTTFTRFQYTFLTSRLRSSKGVPIRLRSATNPGDKGHEWVFERFRAWLDPDYPNPARSGEVRWFNKPEGKGDEIEVPPGTPGARPRCFISASLQDNPILLQNDPEYLSRLDDLDPITRAQLKHGNWLIKPGAKKYFNREWCNILTARPSDIIATVRYWDLAGTEKKTEKDDPDWTAGVKMSLRKNGRILIEHCEHFREEPAKTESRIIDTTKCDGVAVRAIIEQDPGQAGKFQVSHYSRQLHGYRVEAVPPTGSKLQRFGPFSAQAANNNVDLLAGPWVNDFCSELEQLPEGAHDDQCDAASGAYMSLVERRKSLLDYLASNA